MALAGLTLLLVATLAVLWPRVVVVPSAAIGIWIAAALFAGLALLFNVLMAVVAIIAIALTVPRNDPVVGR